MEHPGTIRNPDFQDWVPICNSMKTALPATTGASWLIQDLTAPSSIAASENWALPLRMSALDVLERCPSRKAHKKGVHGTCRMFGLSFAASRFGNSPYDGVMYGEPRHTPCMYIHTP